MASCTYNINLFIATSCALTFEKPKKKKKNPQRCSGVRLFASARIYQIAREINRFARLIAPRGVQYLEGGEKK